MQKVARLFLFCACAATACGSQTGDPPADPTPSSDGKRIRDLRDPSAPDRPKHNDIVSVKNAVVVAVDTHDETGSGDRGGIFVADVDNPGPWSGIGVFAPTFVPGNLRVAPGDVLELRGQYQENERIGANVTFASGAVLPQLARPIATFLYEHKTPEPIVIEDVNDLSDYAKAAQWIGMLVRVKNVTLLDDLFVSSNSGRGNAPISQPLPGPDDPLPIPCDKPFPKAASLVNELMPLDPAQLTSGRRFSSITGIVTYFCNFHLAPRSPADFEP